MSDLSFFAGRNHQLQNVVVITGAGRSGKSLVGNLLGSCENVEHIDEPWLLMELPEMVGHGLISEVVAIDIFRTCLYELLNDRILMRHVSFRPSDISSIWAQKSPQEILLRLIGLNSRADVRQYVSEKRTTLVLTLTDTLPFCDFFQKALPGCRIVHVVREGLAVALDVFEKHWLSDEEFSRPRLGCLYRQYNGSGNPGPYYLPSWVELGEEEAFLSRSEFARGVYYWRRLMEAGRLVRNQLSDARLLYVRRFCDLLDQPRAVVGSLTELLGLKPTQATEALLAQLKREDREVPDAHLCALNNDELSSIKEIYREFGMPTNQLDRLTTGRF